MNNCTLRNSNYCGEQSHHHQQKQLKQKQKQFISNSSTTTNKATRSRSSSSSTIIAVVLLSLFGFWIFLWTLMLAVRSVCQKFVKKLHRNTTLCESVNSSNQPLPQQLCKGESPFPVST